MTFVTRRATTADADLVSALNADVQAIHAAETADFDNCIIQ